MRPLKPVLALLALSTLACTGDFFKSCTSTIVGKTVETTKEVTSGVAEGIEEGRKSGTSIDGAVLVSSMDELNASGGLAIVAIEALGPSTSRIVLGVENKNDTPLRVTGLQISALDKQGFVQSPTTLIASEITVPPRAKEKLSVELAIAADQIGTVRAWTTDLPMVAPTTAPEIVPATTP